MKEPTVYERFVDTIKYTGGRYEVELPWKESHALLPDNYVVCWKIETSHASLEGSSVAQRV